MAQKTQHANKRNTDNFRAKKMKDARKLTVKNLVSTTNDTKTIINVTTRMLSVAIKGVSHYIDNGIIKDNNAKIATSVAATAAANQQSVVARYKLIDTEAKTLVENNRTHPLLMLDIMALNLADECSSISNATIGLLQRDAEILSEIISRCDKVATPEQLFKPADLAKAAELIVESK